MNFLVHLYLSGSDPGILVGNFMGDFVKGRVDDRFPHPLRDGIRFHRKIDSFAEHHPAFVESRRRLSPRYGLYRGVLVDLFYDHFLASGWKEWSGEPLETWLARIRGTVERQQALLPERLSGLVPIIFDELIPSYHEVEGIGRALERMAQRARKPNPLTGGEEELVRHYAGLQVDFRTFLADAREFADRYLGGVVPVPPSPPASCRR